MSLLEGFGLDLGSLLTPSIRLALPYISHGVAAGLSGDQIQAALSSAGMGVRRQTLLGVVKLLRGQASAAQTIRGSKAASFIPPDLLTPSAGFTRNVYQYKFVMSGEHAVTGEQTSRYIIVGNDSPMTLQQAEEQAYQTIAEGLNKYELLAISATLVSATVDPRFVP